VHAYRAASPARRTGTRAAAPRRARKTDPVGVLFGGDGGSRVAGALDLQRTFGNRAVALLVSTHDGGGNTPTVRLHGQTSGSYDGGSSKVLNKKVTRAKGCNCPQDDPCLKGTGTLEITYHVDVTIVMPDVPGGLNACQTRRVRTFLHDVLGPHEREHARRLRTYNGTSSRPFSVTSCGHQALSDDVNAKLHEMHDSESTKRADDAERLSSAIDPFERDIDLRC